MSEITIRPAVMRFALAMERQLRANDHKGGWQRCTKTYLLRRCTQELGELRRRFPKSSLVTELEWRTDIAHEAADVANFAMMIADNFGVIEE